MVPKLSVVLIAFNILLGIALPVGAMLYLKHKKNACCVSFWIGAAEMVLFALVLEQMLHSVVLRSTPIAQSVFGYALYGAAAAALFEETGRYLAMRFALKRQHGNRANALMFGAGHGGIEMALILTISMFNNLLYAVMLNTGRAETLLAPLTAENRIVLENAFAALIETPPAMFLLSPMERIAAFAAQMALSAIVWTGAADKKRGRWLLAVALHMGLDFVSALLARLGLPTLFVECVVWAVSAGIVLIALRIWRKEYKPAE